ncbi:MAG: isoleucine--tRNA ligase [Elusimicrobia bacterium]|nr:isoleucine--tRNA ligase [Elusimicrobiota bacterium]
MENTEKKSYSNTVFLPKTSFSMKANLVNKEPEIIKFWNEKDIYFEILKRNENSKTFFLHDGPPYANGHIHTGHSLNKILKDFVIKSHSIMGYRTPYIPGWDCHGLPIEQQLLKELKISKRHITDVADFRKKAREFAQKFVDIQRNEFKRLGVFADWEHPYITMSKDYEATVVKAFLELMEKGYIERDKKTISWCPICETALADAEVEYNDKVSHTVFVKFNIKKSIRELENFKNLSIVIWTTTPWTLPANMAAAVNKNELYAVLKFGDEHLLVADKLLEYFLKSSGISAEKVYSIQGEKLIGIEYEAPFVNLLKEKYRYNRKIIATDFVDMTTGSGIVHIAPGHGEDDYFAGKKWNIDIFCPVREDGKFSDDVTMLEGKFVFDANDEIIDMLKNKNLLLAKGSINHSYPHCWRCKNPIIFRATEQWFLKIDKHSLRDKLLDLAKGVRWIPESGYERISSMIRMRPDWCLSRQRYWGTPIIAFYCKKCGKLQKDFTVLNDIQKRIERDGSDFWFSLPIKEIIPSSYRCECGSSDFEKEKDILDVWLDSGISWYSVCKNRENIYPVDLYLEGSDQHRGWFQTSLIPSVALNSTAPYKTVLTHGFVLDENGKAMHKSLGNVVSPDDVIKKYGAEILRLWVALSNWNEDVRISDKLLAVPIDMYRKIRNTFRYLLGNLNDFKPQKKISYADMLEIDRYMLIKLSALNKGVLESYRDFEYRKAIKAISDFCIIELSSFYLDVLKDRLYTMPFDSLERRSAQSAMYEILRSLLVMTSPVLSFTSEEAWQTFKKEVDGNISESVFLNDMSEINIEYKDDMLSSKWDKIISIRSSALKEIENARKNGLVGSSLEAKIIFSVGDDDYNFIEKNLNDITVSCIVSQAEVKRSQGDLRIEVIKADGEKCPRCWQWSVDIGKDDRYPELCLKCASAMKKNSNNG